MADYLVIDDSYRIYRASTFTGYMRGQVKQGNMSVLQLRELRGIERARAKAGSKLDVVGINIDGETWEELPWWGDDG